MSHRRCLLTQLLVLTLCCAGMDRPARAQDPLSRLDPERYGPGTILAAIEELSTYHPPQANEAVQALLGHPDQAVARAAAWYLRRGGLGESAAAVAAAVLADGANSVEERASAALALGELRAAAGLVPLATALAGDPQEQVRIQAAEALGRLARPGQSDTLLAAAWGDPAPRVRSAAARALGWLPDLAVEPLFELLVSGEPFSVRREVAWLLGHKRFVAASGVVGQLTRALQSDPDCRVRAAAAWALGRQGDASARTALEATVAAGCRLAAQAAERALEALP